MVPCTSDTFTCKSLPKCYDACYVALNLFMLNLVMLFSAAVQKEFPRLTGGRFDAFKVIKPAIYGMKLIFF